MGSYRSFASGDDVFAYLRENDRERVVVALNFASTSHELVGLPVGLSDGQVEVLCGTHRAGRIRLSGLELAPNEALVVRT